MTTFKQALAELEDTGVAVYHQGTPISSAYFTIDGTSYTYNKFKGESMSAELRKTIKEEYAKLKQQNKNEYKDVYNETMPQQEFTKDGLPSMRPYLKYLLDRGYADQVNVKWGKGNRDVIIIGGKKYPYKGGDEFNKNLKKKITSLYISMSEKS